MKRGQITLDKPQRFTKDYEISKDKLAKAVNDALTKLSDKMEKYGLRFPENRLGDPVGRVYEMGDNENWLCGLHTGCFLLAYNLSGDKKFFDIAAQQMESYIKRVETKHKLDDHDVGFVYSPSCVAYYKMTGDERVKKAALDAAEHLYNYSYSQKGGFILRMAKYQHEIVGCRTMMDTLLNIPLFYWAYEMTSNTKFLDAANSQVDITAKYLIRPDGSSYHHYQFDVGTHAPLHGVTFQGNRDESTWSRGHSWGVLGFPLAYGYTKKEELLPLHRDVTYFMLNHLPEDNIPYWDYDFIDGDEPRDSSAAVIASCGMLEAANFITDSYPEKNIYKNAATAMIDSVIDTCTGDIGDDYDGIIYKVTGAKKMNAVIEGCAPYGDFFYLEALLRLSKPDWKHMW